MQKSMGAVKGDRRLRARRLPPGQAEIIGGSAFMKAVTLYCTEIQTIALCLGDAVPPKHQNTFELSSTIYSGIHKSTGRYHIPHRGSPNFLLKYPYGYIDKIRTYVLI